MYDTQETLCEAYNNLGEIPMETFLYHSEYEAYNHDLNGDHPIDYHLYYLSLHCDLLP